jgi:excisionase family DNA binding protein
MNEYLTSRQVQDLLQVDRTTIYRMLKDGRLTGVKIGGQWRFHAQAVNALVEGQPEVSTYRMGGLSEPLSLGCIQPIQDVFAELAEVGAVTTNLDGEPVTEISNCSSFCDLILAQPSGRQACTDSWRKLAAHPSQTTGFSACHAGLQYARSCIAVGDTPSAMLIAGQFYADQPDPVEEQARVEYLATLHGIDIPALQAAVRSIPILHQSKRAKIGAWLTRVAGVFSEVGNERRNYIRRLRAIAAMSALDQREDEA